MEFSFIKNCLMSFNYPLAHSMSDEELSDIFKTSNRCFLISWMLKLLDSAYEEALENSENDKDFLGNCVYELGFCTQKEKLPFVTGDLPVNRQLTILYNMFNFITDIKKYNVEKDKNRVTNDEILTLNNTNLNLFPMYGDIRLAGTENGLNLTEFNKEINEIQASILNEKEIDPDEDLMEYKFTEDIQVFLKKLKEELPNFKFILENICKKKDIKSNEVIKVQTNSAEILRKCGESLRIISQFIKDINTIEDFMDNDIERNEEEGERNVTYSEMMATLDQDILTAIKHSRCS